MIDKLVENIDSEIGILKDISKYSGQIESANESDKKFLENSIASLTKTMKTINSAIPQILNNTSAAQPLYSGNKKTDLQQFSIQSESGERKVTLNKSDKDKFFMELGISDSLLKRIKGNKTKEKESYEDFKSSRGYLKYSNKFFLNSAKGFVQRGYFKDLAIELKRANMDMLLEAYIAMIFFTSSISAIFGLVSGIILLFFNIGLTFPFFTTYTGSIISRLIYPILLPVILPVIVFAILYYYPSTEKDSIAKKIDQELPFAVIHMSSISGSGIEPSEIFKIIGLSREYPNLRREIRKVLNQINIYGYDLVTALNNVSKSTPSSKLSELFSGLATTIGSGGDLSQFFEKRSETLLLGYRLEREKYSKLAETFMDIYISVVIATPMILMLLLIILSVSAPDLGFSPNLITFFIVLAVSLINVFFLIFLQLKQPTY